MLSHGILYSYIMSFLGTPYIWAGDDPIRGFDCSGFAVEILQAAGAIPHRTDFSSQGLYNLFKHQQVVGKLEPQFLDLVFYGKGSEKVSHVAIFLGDDKIVEASGGGRGTTDEEIAALQNAFIRVRPWHYRSDVVGFYRPIMDFMSKPSS